MRLSTFKSFGSAYRTLGIAFISAMVLFDAGCGIPPRPVSPPPPPPKPIPESELQAIKRLIKEGRYDFAMMKADHLKDPKKKDLWIHIVANAWNLADLKKADGLIKSGSPDQSLPFIDKILERDPLYFKKAPVDLAHRVWVYYLRFKIRADQEFWVLENSPSTAFLDPGDIKAITVEAYTHLAQRRLEEKKYHAALIDVRRALKVSPTDSKALSIRAELALLEKTWTNNGDMAFTRQHLHRALFYWGQVVDLNPQNKEVEENIRKARSLLKKLEVLEKENKPK